MPGIAAFVTEKIDTQVLNALHALQNLSTVHWIKVNKWSKNLECLDAVARQGRKGGVGVGEGGLIIGDAMITFKRSQIRDPSFRDPRIRD